MNNLGVSEKEHKLLVKTLVNKLTDKDDEFGTKILTRFLINLGLERFYQNLEDPDYKTALKYFHQHPLGEKIIRYLNRQKIRKAVDEFEKQQKIENPNLHKLDYQAIRQTYSTLGEDGPEPIIWVRDQLRKEHHDTKLEDYILANTLFLSG